MFFNFDYGCFNNLSISPNCFINFILCFILTLSMWLIIEPFSLINISIGKFFDNIQVTMNDKSDTAELERVVLQCMDRALSIATSTDR